MQPANARPRVALVTSDAYPQLYEDDLLLVAALDEIGIDSRPAVWSDASFEWRGFDALVIRSPWDYFVRPVEFREWLDARIASGVRMCNAPEILDWNFDKKYLQDLARAGVSLVPTIVVQRGEPADVASLMSDARARGWDDIVVKPTVSGGAYETYRFRVEQAGDHREDIARILRDRGLLIQPFLPEILTEGELSLLFFDGVFSHAVCKRPQKGDYRVQFQFGGTTETVDVRPEWIAGARACIAAAPALPVYARVDGVIHEGKFLLMELEVFEPLMFLARHPLAAGRFARAIQGRLGVPNGAATR
jgi:glutathione synthase/RimK-type ligase-like ATP-grasp enzyme